MFKKISKKRSLKKAEKVEKKLQKALKKEAVTLEKQRKTAYDRAVVSWEAPEFLKHRKGLIWYGIFLLLFLVGAVLAFIYDGWTFALVLAIFPFAYFALDYKKPKKIKIILSDVGIKIGKKIYQYNRIQAFWIHYTPPVTKTLNIRVYGEYLSEIEIQLMDEDPAKIQAFLATKIPAITGKQEGLISILGKLLKI